MAELVHAEFYGLQPNSEYQWNPLFTLRNKSAETIKVTVRATDHMHNIFLLAAKVRDKLSRELQHWGNQGQPLVIDRSYQRN